MTTSLAHNLDVQPPLGNLTIIDFASNTSKADRRSTSMYTSRGIIKPSAAEPIRSLDDIRAIQEYFLSRDKIRYYTIFTIGIMFGLRAGDLLSLRIHHILRPDGRFKTHCDLIESKTRKHNNPAITPQAQEVLTNYLATLPHTYTLDDPLFVSSHRDKKTGALKPITLAALNTELYKAARACSIPDHVSSHSLRKTFVYHILKSNPDNDSAKFAVQTMLNHNDFKTTLKYCGITQEEVDEFRAGISNLFAGEL